MFQPNLVSRFFDNTADTYDRIVTWTTLGKDENWKEKILEQIPSGKSFLDLGCGTGILTRKIARKFPTAKIIGADVTLSYLKIAKRNSSSYKNIEFIHQDVEKLALDSKFDCIVSSYVPKYCDPQILAKISTDRLNSNGRIVLHDFIYPKNQIVQALWNFYFVVLRFFGNFVSEWMYAFSELPKLIRASDWLKQYEQEMKNHGFDVKIHRLTCNCAAILVATRKNTSE